MSRLLLCTDLDRTLLPNGSAPESPGARERFARLAAHPEVTLVYVTGRDQGRVDEALATWLVPAPDLLIGDVGTTIATRGVNRWERWTRWDETIAADWKGYSVDDLRDLLDGLPGLVLQDPSRQGIYKLSYTTSADEGGPAAARAGQERLIAADVKANVIWSLDESAGVGLLDVLPAAATKRLAIEFVMAEWGFELDEVVFAGDSGNDLDVLTSTIPAVLVANARPELREAARREAETAGHGASLHCARGGVSGMNGNYAAGILEGVLHYHPEWAGLLENGS
jgi:HAD superfamily hydrolase (TIGR01484 family)